MQLTNPDGKFTEASNYAKYFHFLGRITKNISVEKITKWRLSLADKPYDASESAGAYWAWMRANQETDNFSPNQKKELLLDTKSQNRPDSSITIYENKSFRRVSCLINLPSQVDSTDPQLHGLTDRYSAYTIAQVVLMDPAEFPKADKTATFKPETFSSRVRK